MCVCVYLFIVIVFALQGGPKNTPNISSHFHIFPEIIYKLLYKVMIWRRVLLVIRCENMNVYREEVKNLLVQWVFPQLKEPGPIASDFFQTLWDFGIRRKFIFFSLWLWWILQLKMYRLEDINENVTSYGYHNLVYTVRYNRQMQNT